MDLNYNDERVNVWIKSYTKFVGCDGWPSTLNIPTLIKYSKRSKELWYRIFRSRITDAYIKPALTIFIHISIL